MNCVSSFLTGERLFDVAGTTAVAALAGDFGLVANALTVGTAILVLAVRNAGTDRVAAFLCICHNSFSNASPCSASGPRA